MPSTKFVFFWPIGKNKMAALASDWLRHFSTSPLKPLNRIQRSLIESKISTPSTKFVFLGPIGKTKWPPCPLIVWHIFDFSEETAERNSTKLDRKQALNAFYHICVFQANREKTKWPPWPLIGWDIFDFSSETAPLLFLVLFEHFSRVHCTQVSDSGPLSLLFLSAFNNIRKLAKTVFLYDKRVIAKVQCEQIA